MRFDWLAPPSSEAMIRALELLYAIGVLDTDAKLTTLGHQVAEFPLVRFPLQVDLFDYCQWMLTLE